MFHDFIDFTYYVNVLFRIDYSLDLIVSICVASICVNAKRRFPASFSDAPIKYIVLSSITTGALTYVQFSACFLFLTFYEHILIFRFEMFFIYVYL
jgi:hypothetical protein